MTGNPPTRARVSWEQSKDHDAAVAPRVGMMSCRDGCGVRRARRRLATRVFLALWVAWGVVLIVLRAGEPGLHTGWTWNDAHILTASDWFKVHGHLDTLGLPPRQTAPKPDGSWELYNTFPPGVFWLHELRRAVGIESLAAHRACAVVWNHLAVLLFFVFVRRWTASAALGGVAASLYMFSGPYITGAGGLWEHAPMLSLVGTLVAWTGFERARGPMRVRVRALWLAAAVAMYVLDNLLTVQHAAMIGVLVGCRGLWWLARGWRKAGWRLSGDTWAVLTGVLIMSAVPPIVMAGRVGMQAHVMGGLKPALNYFSERAEARAGMASEAEDELVSVWRVLAVRVGVPTGREATDMRTLQGRFPVLHPIAIAGCAIVLVAGWRFRRSAHLAPMRRGLVLGASAVAAAMTWPVLFPQHAIIHPFVTFMFMPGLGVLAASVIVAPWAIRKASRAAGLRPRKWVWLTLLLATGVVAAPSLASMRRSTALNAWVQIDDHVCIALRDRVERDRLLRVGAPSFADVPLLEVVGGPPIAIHLGRPYRSLIDRRNGPAREPSPESLLVISTRERAAQNLLPKQVRNRGLPRFFADPARVVVFDAVGSVPAEPVTIAPQASDVPDVHWTHASLRPTIDGEALMCAVAVRHGNEQLFASPGGSISVTIRNGDGAPLVTRNTSLEGHSASSRRRLVAWVQVDPREATDWLSIDVVVTAPDGQTMQARIRRGAP